MTTECKINRCNRIVSLALFLAITDQVLSGGRALAATNYVEVSGYSFLPFNVPIKLGDSVKWTGLGWIHNVQTDTDPFCGRPGSTGGTCTIAFNQPGTFVYYCVRHRGVGMVGSVIVGTTNIAPIVAITNPVNGAVFAAPANVTVQADAFDFDGDFLVNVKLFANAKSVGSDTSSPYSFVASNLAAGSYALRAVATDVTSLSGTSEVVNISVVAPVSLALSRPLITNSQVQFNFGANAGLRYVIENSTNLANWTAVTTNTASSSSEKFEEAFNANSFRFYRVGRLPNP